MERIVDPSRFLLLGGLTDWTQIHKQQGGRRRDPPAEAARKRCLRSTQLLQLRWLMSKTLGYPIEPFTVWRRPAGAPQAPEPVPFHFMFSPDGRNVCVLDAPRTQVYIEVRVQGTGNATFSALAGAPISSPYVAEAAVTPTTTRFTMSATQISCLVVPAGWTITQILGLDDSVAEAPDWERIETVGLPVDASWAGIGGFGAGQGFVSQPVDPVQAALARFLRGAPLFGWLDELRPGVPAPAWSLADPKAMIETLQAQLLPQLREMVATLPPGQHAGYHDDPVVLPSNGGNVAATLVHHPLDTLLYGAATDGLASLISGFGTAFEEALFFDDRTGRPRVAHDYMVTALYKDGPGLQPGPVEYAAILYAPSPLGGIPAPANLATAHAGLTSPATADQPWSAVTRVSWDALSNLLGMRVGAYAFAREGISPSTAAVALMRPRPLDTALQPIGLAMPEGNQARRHTTDGSYRLDAAFVPNTVSYAVAHHDLFGLFSPWSNVQATVSEPPVDKVPITMARLEVVNGGTGNLCPAALVFEFSWDWRIRTPDLVQVAGRLYAQAALGEPPSNLGVPTGLASTLANTGGLLTIDFSPDGSAVASAATPGLDASVQYLSPQGTQVLAAPTQDAGIRRYRVSVTGFALDFNAAGRQGMALWARGREARAPGRLGPWPSAPVIASTADPRPPVVVNTREFVQLASLADADGVHHAVLEWPSAPGAAGYFVYACAESKFLSDRGIDLPAQHITLEDRLRNLRDAYAADPNRRSFTRLNETAVAGTRMPVVLPRGTKEIHLFVVIGVSVGQVESTWPTDRLAFCAYAAPQLKVPEPPTLEVVRRFDESSNAYRALVRVRSTPGARVARIDLHRVRVPEAVGSVESMGPPVQSITGSSGAFTVTPTVSAVRGESQPIGTVRGLDDVSGSWKTVYYRAVAWGTEDLDRGLYAGRSASSALRAVVVPPAAPPALEDPAWSQAAAGSADVVVDTAVLVPIAETALGPHRISVEAIALRADGSTGVALAYPEPGATPDPEADRLDLLPEVPGGVWREATTPTTPGEPGRTPVRIRVPRASFDDALRVRVRLTDPLGRQTEHVLDVPPGSEPVVVQPPDILDPQVFSIAGRGRFLSFATTAPDTDADGRPYVLHVSVTQAVLGFPIRARLRVDIELANIRPIASVNSLVRDGSQIPLGRARVGGRTQISALLREAGPVAVSLEAPDGTTASWSTRTRNP